MLDLKDKAKDLLETDISSHEEFCFVEESCCGCVSIIEQTLRDVAVRAMEIAYRKACICGGVKEGLHTLNCMSFNVAKAISDEFGLK